MTDENTIPAVAKPLIIELDGVISELYDGTIINAGGVVGPTFRVGGKPLMFFDGTSTGDDDTGLTFDKVYLYSAVDQTGNAPVTLNGTKGVWFNGSAGSLRISGTGNVSLLGTTSIAGTLTVTADTFTSKALTITPTALGGLNLVAAAGFHGSLLNAKVGTTNLLSVTTDGTAVQATIIGDVAIEGDLSINGLIDGFVAPNIKLIDDHEALQEHIATSDSTAVKHAAAEISVDNVPSVDNMQVFVDKVVETLTSRFVQGYSISIDAASFEWIINHNLETQDISVSVFDSTGEQVFPQAVKIIDDNNVSITFQSIQAGRAVVLGISAATWLQAPQL
jgi:hypothetical protein